MSELWMRDKRVPVFAFRGKFQRLIQGANIYRSDARRVKKDDALAQIVASSGACSVNSSAFQNAASDDNRPRLWMPGVRCAEHEVSLPLCHFQVGRKKQCEVIGFCRTNGGGA
jgi:hypothetical protein